MKVQAKCISRAWDSGAAVLCYPGEMYEIDHDGKLASLKAGSQWVFQFDRTMAGTGQNPSIGGFVCKMCGKTFDSLNDIGTHSNSEHNKFKPKESVDSEYDDEPVKLERRGANPGRTFPCKVPGCTEISKNLYACRVHKKTHEQVEVVAETEAVSV